MRKLSSASRGGIGWAIILFVSMMIPALAATIINTNTNKDDKPKVEHWQKAVIVSDVPTNVLHDERYITISYANGTKSVTLITSDTLCQRTVPITFPPHSNIEWLNNGDLTVCANEVRAG